SGVEPLGGSVVQRAPPFRLIFTFFGIEMYSESGLLWVPVTPPGISVRTPRNRFTGLYFFLSSLDGLTLPSTNAFCVSLAAAKASELTPRASARPSPSAIPFLLIISFLL